jgi:hypothetical protein
MNSSRKWFPAISIFALAAFGTAMHAMPQAASDLSGAWTVTVAPAPPPVTPAGSAPPAAMAPQGGGRGGGGRGPAAPPTLTLKQDGGALTGTLAGGRGPGLPITGSISGSSVTWTVARRLSDGIERPEVYKGTVSGDAITGSVAEPTVDPTQEYSVDFSAKRNPPPAQ